jgi:CheY-like chemotaxis protein
MAKILIVEDNQGTNKAICEYMKEAGHTLFSAFTGSEALKIFREKELDIIVLDIMLPEMSGIVVLHEIRKISNIPVIMLTALDDEYTQSNSFDEMADDYITIYNNEPCSNFSLRTLLTELCEPYRLIAEAKGIKFKIELSSDAFVYLPEGRLKKAISNILSNAVNYTEAGQSISVVFDKNKLSVSNECRNNVTSRSNGTFRKVSIEICRTTAKEKKPS